MRSFTTKIVAFIMLLAFSQSGYSQNWQLVWQDEFNNGISPDWGFDTGGGGWGNNELQHYRRENASVQNGELVITAKRENFGGNNYTSARMKTQGRKSWKYGKIEARIAMPAFNGIWPAFWMLGDNIGSVGWPKCGEIDIMEHINSDDNVFGTIHWDDNGHKDYPKTTYPNNVKNYHTYSIEWNQRQIKWFIDGVQFHIADVGGVNGTDEFQNNFFIILNLAVGGNFPGFNIDNNGFPAAMRVDYVRVYQDNGVPQIPASTDVITAYNDCNFGGFSGGLTIGDYNLERLKSIGIASDVISSLRITQGYQAILFQDDNFGGASTVINSDNNCLNTTWNDKVTSIRILANGVTNLQGAYTLQNRNSGLNMDVRGGESNKANGAQIQQWNAVTTSNQIFEFTHLGDGLYKIIAKSSGKSLDVNGFNKDNGALVQQYDYNATVNQQFIVVDAGGGYYKLVARHSGKIVEVAGCSTALEAIVQQWDNNNQTCGQWKFNAPIPSSTDVITAYNDCNYSGFSGGLTIGDYNLARLQSLGVNNDEISSLRITQGYQAILYQDDNFGGVSTVINSDNACLNTTWNNKVTSIRIIANGVTNLQGAYTLQNRNSGLNMDVRGGEGNVANGAQIQQWNVVGSKNQIFEFTHLGDGLYKIIARNSGKSLDVNGFNKANGALVNQYDYNATVNQQFIVVDAGGGYYKLVARHSGRIVEVAGCSNALEAIVQQWDNNNQTCGQWKFNTLVVVPPVDGTGDGLTGNYFNGMNFETPVYSRKDATLNFDWGNGSPNASVNADGFSARWTGQIQPKYSGVYTFYMNSDNGRRVWINGQLIIDKWMDDWGIEYSANISLTANQKYDIKVEYFENNGGANAKLEWSHASQTREIVPTKQLYSNNLPAISILTPSTTASFDSPANMVFTSSGADNGGSIAKVEYYNGGTKIGESTSGSSYSVNWSNVAAGTYTVTARAIDNQGGVAVSAALIVKVNQGTAPVNQAPLITLTSPANGSSYNAPASIVISANASDNDGTIAKVEFYNGTQKLGEDASSPYSYTMSNAAAGNYTISAKAFDDKGATTASGSVSVTVKVVTTNACSSLADYAENAGYVPGSKVKNGGRLYECKEFPYSGWCNGAAWAYGAGTGAYWTDAWYDRGSCGARTGEESASLVSNEVTIAPNPASDFINIQLNAASDVSIFNSQGTQVLSSTRMESNSTLNISNLAAGMYFVKIDTGSAIMTKMILKQ